jgi:multicomponent Na+:H+ antiporter subunit A
MAAPTPVSAYLHAAAMVKAGIYLIARLRARVRRERALAADRHRLGIFTMLLGGFQALRESDLKRILAFGTVSQLGMLTVVLGYGERNSALAGLAPLIGHALFKSSLFLVVGVIDRQLSTRDIGELSGVGARRPRSPWSRSSRSRRWWVSPPRSASSRKRRCSRRCSRGTRPEALIPLLGIPRLDAHDRVRPAFLGRVLDEEGCRGAARPSDRGPIRPWASSRRRSCWPR